MAACLAFGVSSVVSAQTAQKGADAAAKTGDKLRIEYVGYRPARYETAFLSEPSNERPNRGGLISVYFRNVSDGPLRLAFWRANGEDESYWRLGGFLAWDRAYEDTLAPGVLTVLEINAVAAQFGEGKPFAFSYVDREQWRPVGKTETQLREDGVQVSLIRVLPGLRNLEVHVRNRGRDKAVIESIAVDKHAVKTASWVGQTMEGPSQAIGRLELEDPLHPSELLVVELTIKVQAGSRVVYAHRRAFEDGFPIGCWSNDEKTYAILRRLHIDTCVRGGRADDEFYAQVAPKYGFRTMAPTGKPVDVDQLRSLGDHPAVVCWMLADEPDWNTTPDVMLFVDQTVRRYNSTKPTFITLCRNVKFFEYASISDIPCMDHYCVTAPTSSKWPKVYGTHLEETGYYTRDLKRAAEPKPIWVWSQAIADWEERPRRPVPTPDELAVQLVQNLGAGAKGILWFNYSQEMAERYPDVRDAVQRWGRVLQVTREDFLAAEPCDAAVEAPEKVEAAPLVAWDKLLLCVTNVDYEIDDEAYPFVYKSGVRVSLDPPEWIAPVVALRVSPDGVVRAPFAVTSGRIEITLDELTSAAVLVLANEAATESAYAEAYQRALEEEKREF
jgi:hypothetical protein